MKVVKFMMLVGVLVCASCNYTPKIGELQQRIHDGLTVDSTCLYDIYGDPFVMRGVNVHWTWSGETGMRQIEAVSRTGANTVRIVLSDGEQWNMDDAATVQSVLDRCKELKMVAILEVHDATGNDTASALIRAAQYFVDLSPMLDGTEDYVIVNIANEWMQMKDDSLWADTYKRAIAMLRNAGIKHCVMIDSDGYGQGVDCIRNVGRSVLDSDQERNVIFSVHMYGHAGNAEMVKSNIDGIVNQGLALCIGEFGWYHSDGDVDEDQILAYCKEKNVGWLAWSWYGNGNPVRYLDLVTDPVDEHSLNAPTINDSISCDWGKKVVDAIKSESKVLGSFNRQ